MIRGYCTMASERWIWKIFCVTVVLTLTAEIFGDPDQTWIQSDGCYNSSYVLSNLKEQENRLTQNSPTNCFSECDRGKNYQNIYLQDDTCICSNTSAGTDWKVPGFKCGSLCDGTHPLPCGGNGTVSKYSRATYKQFGTNTNASCMFRGIETKVTSCENNNEILCRMATTTTSTTPTKLNNGTTPSTVPPSTTFRIIVQKKSTTREAEKTGVSADPPKAPSRGKPETDSSNNEQSLFTIVVSAVSAIAGILLIANVVLIVFIVRMCKDRRRVNPTENTSSNSHPSAVTEGNGRTPATGVVDRNDRLQSNNTGERQEEGSMLNRQSGENAEPSVRSKNYSFPPLPLPGHRAEFQSNNRPLGNNATPQYYDGSGGAALEKDDILEIVNGVNDGGGHNLQQQSDSNKKAKKKKKKRDRKKIEDWTTGNTEDEPESNEPNDTIPPEIYN